METIEEVFRDSDQEARQKWLRVLFPEYAQGGALGQPGRVSDPTGYVIATEILDPNDRNFKPITPKDIDLRGAFEKRVLGPLRESEASWHFKQEVPKSENPTADVYGEAPTPISSSRRTSAEEATAEEEWDRMAATGATPFQLKESTEAVDIPEDRAEDPMVIKKARQLWKEKGTESPFFKKWFSNSKMVYQTGKPRTVNHGTTGDFNNFSSVTCGLVTKAESTVRDSSRPRSRRPSTLAGRRTGTSTTAWPRNTSASSSRKKRPHRHGGQHHVSRPQHAEPPIERLRSRRGLA